MSNEEQDIESERGSKEEENTGADEAVDEEEMKKKREEENKKLKEVTEQIRKLLRGHPKYKLDMIDRFAEFFDGKSLAELTNALENLELDIQQGEPWSDLERVIITGMDVGQSYVVGVTISEEVFQDEKMRASFREATKAIFFSMPAGVDFIARWAAKTLSSAWPWINVSWQNVQREAAEQLKKIAEEKEKSNKVVQDQQHFIQNGVGGTDVQQSSIPMEGGEGRKE